VSGIGALVSHHPWWAVAAVAAPVVMAVWVIVGGILLESRHGDEVAPHHR
jgi:hypothetical protein